MRRSIAALALSRRQDDQGRTRSLAQWNGKWNAYAFVGGHKWPEESFRQCMIREIEEELALRHGSEFTVARDPLTHLQYTAWSQNAQEETQYTIELFEVALTDSARQKVDAEPNNRWLTDGEIRLKCCDDGARVSETVPLIFNKVGLPPTPNDDASFDHVSS